MFDDGLDGYGGDGTRFNGNDDQMLVGVAGYTWNLTKAQSRTQRELVQAKKAAESVPALKRANEELKVAQAEIEDELEVVKIQKAKVEQRLDSLNQGLTLPAGAGNAGTSIGSNNASTNGGRFVVVVGSFRSSLLAEQYVRRLKKSGVSCSTADSDNGFVRVFTGPFNSETAALDALAKVRAETPGAWLLRL
ncbi:MAG: SPOR domain-containing protein, partial [Schleiferiaceae bacterium]